MNAGKQAAGPLDGAVVIAASLVLAIAVLALATPCSVEDPERSWTWPRNASGRFSVGDVSTVTGIGRLRDRF